MIDFSSLLARLWQRPFAFCLVVLGMGGLFGVLGFGGYLALRSPLKNLEEGYYSLAKRQYQAEAEAGNLQAQTVLGNLYLLGLGVEADGRLVARWYLKAALAGFVPAQINLGQLYLNGRGVPRHIGNAVGWFHLARSAGSKRAAQHMDYITGTNATLPLMFDAAIEKFNDLAIVQDRFERLGEPDFLLQ